MLKLCGILGLGKEKAFSRMGKGRMVNWFDDRWLREERLVDIPIKNIPADDIEKKGADYVNENNEWDWIQFQTYLSPTKYVWEGKDLSKSGKFWLIKPMMLETPAFGEKAHRLGKGSL